MTGTKNAFNALISRLDMAEERISELDIATECSKTKPTKPEMGLGRSKPEDSESDLMTKILDTNYSGLLSELVRQETMTFCCVCVRERV